jgi:hypothetical protein
MPVLLLLQIQIYEAISITLSNNGGSSEVEESNGAL